MEKRVEKVITPIVKYIEDKLEGKEAKRIFSPEKYYEASSKEVNEEMEQLYFMYCMVSAKANGYLPSFHSDLGQNIQYLQGVYEGILKIPTFKNEMVKGIQFAPEDHELEVMLWSAQGKSEKHSKIDYGLHHGMGDTEWMISMIIMMDPETKLVNKEKMHGFKLYPV